MFEDFLYDEKLWIIILIVLVIIFVLGIQLILIAIILWIIFLLWNKYKIKMPPFDK
jgi:hypothetical protein